MRARFAGVFVVALVVAGLQTAAVADDEKPNLEEAKRAFKAGQEFLQMDRFAEAVVEFKKAYAVTKDGLVMGQIALAYEKAGDYEAALESLEVYRAALPEADRASVDEMEKRYKAAIAEGRSTKLALPGEQGPSAGNEEEEETEGTTRPAGDGTDDGGRRKGRFWTWIAAGSAGAFALGAVVVGLNAQSKFNDLEDSCKPACAQSEIDSVETRAVTADVLWGLTAAAAVTAGVLYFLEGRPRRGGGNGDPADGGGGATEEDDDGGEDEEEFEDDFYRRVQVMPLVGQGQYGLGAVIRY